MIICDFCKADDIINDRADGVLIVQGRNGVGICNKCMESVVEIVDEWKTNRKEAGE